MVAEIPVLAAIYEVYATGDFEPSVVNPVKKGEEVIGKLDPFGKAIYTVGVRWAARYNRMVDELERTRAKPDMDELTQLRKVADTAQRLFWPMVRASLGAEDGSRLEMRTRYQIVKAVPGSENGGLEMIMIAAPEGMDLKTILDMVGHKMPEEK
jgi:hypothetical protein